MALLIPLNMWVWNQQALPLKSKVLDGKVVLEVAMQDLLLPVAWKVRGRKPRSNGITTFSKPYLDMNGKSQKALPAYINGYQRIMQAPIQCQTHTILQNAMRRSC